MFITASGIVCPVGLTSAAACAALRANISAFKELPYSDNQGEPIVGAAVPGYEKFPRNAADLVDMLAEAVAQLLRTRPDKNWAGVPLLVGLAEPGRAGGYAALADSAIQQVQTAQKANFHPRHSRCFTTGHTAGFEALGEARRLLADPSVAGCIVCGVDSLLNARALLQLDADFRLKTPANRDGLIPGEAAAAVLVERSAPSAGAVEVAGLGYGEEEASILSDQPLLGLGLTAAARAALAEAGLGMHEIDCRFSDVTGELYGFKELPLMESRLMRVVRQAPQPMWHWSETIGDAGAAAGPLQLAAAGLAFHKGYVPGERMICLTSAAGGHRAVAVLRGSAVA